jgi:hypothetical protein
MVNAQTLCLQLGGHWYGIYGVAPCPICQSERRKGQNALTLSDGKSKLLAHCKKAGCSFHDIAVAAGVRQDTYRPPSLSTIAQNREYAEKSAMRRSLQAKALWSEAIPIMGTLGEKYLRNRGITCGLPDTLRFLRNCWHPTGKRIPSLIALVEGVEGFAIHRTYLQLDGSAKTQVSPNKAMLGKVSGGAVRLTSKGNSLVVTEGIETALSLSSGLLDFPATIWAALSTSGLQGLKLPETASNLIIASDGDAEGRKAAYKLALRAEMSGWQVSFLDAPEGQDWNDVLNVKGEAT